MVLVFLAMTFGFRALGAETVSINPAYLHLGDSVVKDWKGVEPKPEGTNLVASFVLNGAVEGTLRLKQRDIHGVWRVRMNGKEIAQLRREEGERVAYYAVPASAVHPGTNQLEILPDNKTDDIAVGIVDWLSEPLRVHLKLQPLTVRVSEGGFGGPVPSRISITSADGAPADLYYCEAEDTAVRPGILYTRGVPTRVEVLPGAYRIAATRGMEWGRDERVVVVAGGEASVEEISLRLRREVRTPGYVACDTHIHTFTHSGHGNATMEERMMSLAGEGVELAVATDHNHHIDYAPVQGRLSLTGFFTPVVGNEVTSDNGHFNAFPMDPSGKPPVSKEADWVKLIDGIRAAGARVVVLNHPRWPDVSRNPFTKAGLNRASGDRAKEGAFTFDAMELVNSTALQKDPLYLFRDWFALLNRGERITAVGSSDTHSVDDPVGQGRSYVASSTDIPSRISIPEACQNILAGKVSVSLGMFADVKVQGRFGMGDLVDARSRTIAAKVRVAAPAWIDPMRVLAFLNGVQVAEVPLSRTPGKPFDAEIKFNIRARDYDSYLVFVALGSGVPYPGWKTYEHYTLAATNPVYLDADGDGKYRSPREEALRRLGPATARLEAVLDLIRNTDPALGVQIASAARGRLDASSLEPLREFMEDKAREHELYGLFVRHMPQPAAR